jgi:hypothetical protein
MMAAAVLHRPIFRTDVAAREPQIAAPPKRLEERPVLEPLRARQGSRHRRVFASEVLLVKTMDRHCDPGLDPGEAIQRLDCRVTRSSQ